MNARDRLQRLQAALKERGVEDVKFFFSSTDEKPLSQVATEVAEALEAYLAGHIEPMAPLNDCHCA